jgi:TctA family transporter
MIFLAGLIIGILIGVVATIITFSACMLSSKISREEEERIGRNNAESN